MTLKEAEKHYAQILIQVWKENPYGTEQEAQASLRWLMESVLDWSPTQFILNQNQPLSPEAQEKIEAGLERLKTGEPIQYIIAEVDFADLKLKVNPHVLIPRPETEELAQLFIQKYKRLFQQRKEPMAPVMDLCTGSGCLALAVAKALQVAAYGVDYTIPIVNLAKENAQKNNLLHIVQFFQSDILKGNSLEKVHGKIGGLISNPPYIPKSTKKEVDRRVHEYEPAEALFVEDAQPLLFYERMAQWGPYLSYPRLIALECHENLAQAVANLLKQNQWEHVEIKQDFRGKQRFVFAQFPKKAYFFSLPIGLYMYV